MTIIIERETQRGAYDLSYDVMIVERPQHGRLLLIEGFGGIDSVRGGAYRWEHGAAYRLQPTDTLESLRGQRWNEVSSLYDAVIAGWDDSRPVLEWHGGAVAASARAALHM